MRLKYIKEKEIENELKDPKINRKSRKIAQDIRYAFSPQPQRSKNIQSPLNEDFDFKPKINKNTTSLVQNRMEKETRFKSIESESTDALKYKQS